MKNEYGGKEWTRNDWVNMYAHNLINMFHDDFMRWRVWRGIQWESGVC